MREVTNLKTKITNPTAFEVNTCSLLTSQIVLLLPNSTEIVNNSQQEREEAVSLLLDEWHVYSLDKKIGENCLVWNAEIHMSYLSCGTADMD